MVLPWDRPPKPPPATRPTQASPSAPAPQTRPAPQPAPRPTLPMTPPATIPVAEGPAPGWKSVPTVLTGAYTLLTGASFFLESLAAVRDPLLAALLTLVLPFWFSTRKM